MVLGALLTAMIGQESASTECRRDGTTIQVNACVLDDLALEEARMEAYLAAARSRALDRDRASETYGGDASQQSAYLDASQSAWEAYAAIRCGGVYDQWRQGTIRTVMSVGCHSKRRACGPTTSGPIT
jgi:uncharacterized protein YecT (DUF1311 family)